MFSTSGVNLRKRHNLKRCRSNQVCKEYYYCRRYVAISVQEWLAGLLWKFIHWLTCFINLLTVPVTVTTSEWSFVKLKLIKTFYRSTITIKRLTNLALVTGRVTAISNNLYKQSNVAL